MSDVLAKALTPATVGEWVQGWIGGREALVSLVVDWKGTVELLRGGGKARPALDAKAGEAFALARKRYGESAFCDVYPSVDNALPRARGFATSTMDIAGVLAVCAAYTGRRESAEELFSLCASIEPSDGIMFEALALVDHLNGRLLERLPPPPPMTLLALVPARTLDTAEYRKEAGRAEVIKSLAFEHERAYALLREGLLGGDAAAVAEAATISAAAQQQVLPRAEWELLLGGRDVSGALGIAVAHSGTASALIFAEGDEARIAFAELWFREKSKCRKYETVKVKVCGGGIKLSM